MTVAYEVWDFVKKNFVIIVVAVVFLIWYGGCNKSAGGHTTSDTTSHTEQVVQPIIIYPPYTPQQQGNTVYPITIPQQYSPSADITKLTEQYSQLVKEFLAVKNYKDSIQLRDTAGNRVGVVNLDQIVSENTLKSTLPSYQLSFPHTTTTITNTVYPAPKRQVFLGVGVESALNKPSFKQVDLGITLKNKKDNLFQLGGFYDIPTKTTGVRVGYYQKLTFKLF